MKTNFNIRAFFAKFIGDRHFFILSTVMLWIMLYGTYAFLINPVSATSLHSVVTFIKIGSSFLFFVLT
jgi:hypothetical protein